MPRRSHVSRPRHEGPPLPATGARAVSPPTASAPAGPKPPSSSRRSWPAPTPSAATAKPASATCCARNSPADALHCPRRSPAPWSGCANRPRTTSPARPSPSTAGGLRSKNTTPPRPGSKTSRNTAVSYFFNSAKRPIYDGYWSFSSKKWPAGACWGTHRPTKSTRPRVGQTQVLGAVLALQTIVMARMPSTTPSDTATGILKMSISIILVPMKTRITARP